MVGTVKGDKSSAWYETRDSPSLLDRHYDADVVSLGKGGEEHLEGQRSSAPQKGQRPSEKAMSVAMRSTALTGTRPWGGRSGCYFYDHFDIVGSAIEGIPVLIERNSTRDEPLRYFRPTPLCVLQVLDPRSEVRLSGVD